MYKKNQNLKRKIVQKYKMKICIITKNHDLMLTKNINHKQIVNYDISKQEKRCDHRQLTNKTTTLCLSNSSLYDSSAEILPMTFPNPNIFLYVQSTHVLMH